MKSKIRNFIGTGVKSISAAYVNDLRSGSTLYKNQANPHYTYFSQWQSKKLLSKFALPGKNDEKRSDAALEKFFKNQDRLRQVVISENRTLKLARGWVKLILDEFNIEELYEECKHSNGADTENRYAYCNIEDKFSLPLSGNLASIRQFEDYLDWDTDLKQVLRSIAEKQPGPFYMEVNEGRITTVPKNFDIDRVILVGSRLDMFFQQGIMQMITRRLKLFGIDISTQALLHRELVYPMSVTHSHATIDFASASDSVSLQLCRYLLPREWFKVLLRFRTPSSQYGSFPMISSMGNAYTFPLETLVFFAIGLAVTQRGNRNTTLPDTSILVNSRVSVFGDDVIIEQLYAPEYISVCESVGLLVNVDKTFAGYEGFRESCGVDVFDYRNVRPWYIQSPGLETETWLHVASYFVGLFNSFLKKAKPVFGNWVYDCETVRAFAAIFKRLGYQVPVVPSDFPDTAGLKLWHDPLMKYILWQHDVVFSRLTVDFHGTWKFRYWSYRYDDLPGLIFDDLHYWYMMKFRNKSAQALSLLEPLPRRYLVRDKSRVVSSVGTTYIPLDTST